MSNLMHSPSGALVALPLILPVLAAGLSLVFYRQPKAQLAIAATTGAALLAAGGSLLNMVATGQKLGLRLGSWQSPVGIYLEADILTALMLVLAAVMTVVMITFSAGQFKKSGGSLAPLLMVVVLGVNGSFLTRDLFNLYVWFEVLLMGSFGLLVTTGGRDGRQAAVKSLALNLLGSLVFLLAVGVTYGLAGTLDMNDLQVRLAEVYSQRPAAVSAAAYLLLVAFAVKAAMFPFHFWLPASYHVPAAGVCALFAALLTKVGIYSMLRVMSLPFAAVQGWENTIGILAGLTMVLGVLGAVTQFDMRRILAWHSISQIGYMAVGLSLMAAPSAEARLAGLTSTIFFVLHHGLVKPALFLVAGLVHNLTGTTDLKLSGGLYRERPGLSLLFLLAALSLAGIPPLSGFWAKLAVVQAGLLAASGWLVAAALAAGLLTLLSMVKIWIEVFWKPAPANRKPLPPSPLAGWVATVALVLLVTAVGLKPRPLFDLAEKAAAQLLADRQQVLPTVEVSP